MERHADGWRKMLFSRICAMGFDKSKRSGSSKCLGCVWMRRFQPSGLPPTSTEAVLEKILLLFLLMQRYKLEGFFDMPAAKCGASSGHLTAGLRVHSSAACLISCLSLSTALHLR